MPSLSVGFAQVEDRLRIVRRRLNLLTLQDALYLSGSLVALAIALVIVLALRGRAALFAGSVWAAAAAVAAAIVAAALRIHRRWLSVEQVVRLADREAALDDRLATLLSDPSRARASRLRGVLLEQILAAAPRWDIDVLAPRRVPRSVFVLTAALAALVMTSFFARPPASPQPAPAMRPHPSGADAEAEVLRPHAAMKRTDEGGHPGAGHDMQVAGLRGAGEGLARQSSSFASLHEPGMHPGTAPGEQGAERSPTGQQGPHDARSGVGSAESAPPGMAEKLQDAIRQALGAEGSDQTKPDEGGTGRLDDGRQADASAKRGAGSEGSGADRLKSARRGTDSLNSARGNTDPLKGDSDPLKKGTSDAGVLPPSASSDAPGAGSGAGAGARTGQASGGELFAGESGVRRDGTGSQSLSIKLGAFATIAPSQVEPQRQAPPVGDLMSGRAAHNAPAAVGDEQIPDAALQKADVAPEHEALVRRIFTRDE